MAHLIWTDQMSTGIAEQDEQHKILIELINRLNDAIQERKDAEILGTVLTELSNYAVHHFGYEEALMDRHGYADTAVHKLEHQTFIEWMAGIKRKLAEEEAAVSAQVINFLRMWVTGHIMKTDRRMGQELSKIAPE
ncbi:MAG: hemerythrin [Gammaproteobacteria bacterium HGW-Gammaproteobacteria-1]|jgi:hemerythrin-like metal-binding protein|nr:MAG: hemerythrin [Gammaproteobacteria bacterium HGW-Gammaproteobacteria-1]